jgi:Na+/H+-dicarboxylate symporter
MAVPIFGGMFIEVITMLIVPVVFCLIQELKASE